MKVLHGYLVTAKKRYNNSVDVDGTDLILNTELSNRDAEFVSREVTVVEDPMIETPVKKGDQLIVHHNVLRRWEDVRGIERNSGNWITDDLYIVYPDQVFAYSSKVDNLPFYSDWKAMPGYTFVKPIEEQNDWSLELLKENFGEIVMTDLDLSKGTVVSFTPDSEYVFEIDGQTTYRVFSNDIVFYYEH